MMSVSVLWAINRAKDVDGNGGRARHFKKDDVRPFENGT
jgi:hypothetical protein